MNIDYEWIKDYVFPLIVPIIVGIVVAKNVYKYQFEVEKKHEFLKLQITELLLPLYITFKNQNIDINNSDKTEVWYSLPDDTVVRKIAAEKLYLANPKLSDLILEYLELQDQLKIAETSHFSSPDDRKFQEIIIRNQAKTFQEFEQTIIDEYQQTVKEYQRILGKKAGWQFWK